MQSHKKHKTGYYLLILSVILIQNLSAQYKDITIDYFGQTAPGKKAVVFSPDFICTPGKFIQNCCFSQDGKEFFFGETDGNWSFSTLKYTKYENGKWTTPIPLSGNVRYGNYPTLSYDGNDLYITMYKYNNTSSADVYVCHRTADGWSEPERLNALVNSDANEWEISISQNNTLYFSSQRKGGFGDMDVYSAQLVDGDFTNIRNLGAPINTNSLDECPYIAPDESFMIFNSWKANPRYGGNNLYITYRKQDGSWTNPKDLGPNINTNELDIYPYVTPDGKYFMYTRRQAASTASFSKLYWANAEFIDSLRQTNYEPYCKNPIPKLTAITGRFFSYKIPDSTFFDDDENDSLSITVNNLPSWMSYDNKTRTFSGTPTTQAASKWINIIAADLANVNVSTRFSIVVQDPTDVDDKQSSIDEFKLDQNYPNPFNPETVISYTIGTGQLPVSSQVELKIFDILGRDVKTLVDEEQNAGTYNVKFDASQFPSGIYLYKIKAGSFMQTKKMMVLK